MKKILLFASAIAGLLFSASCQQENLEPTADGKTVIYTVEAPGTFHTKAIADGLNVNELIYEVWYNPSGGASEKLYQSSTTMEVDPADGKNKAIVTLDLASNQSYTVLFWAQVAGTGAYDTEELTAVSYAKAADEYLSNDESLAAFYAVDSVNDGAATNSTVYLKRPFAQINLCTLNSKDQADSDHNIALVNSKMRIDAVPTTFNVLTKEVKNYVAMEFGYNAVPSDPSKIIVNGQEYWYAGMNYVFAGVNLVLTYDIQTSLNGSTNYAVATNTISEVPVKENYRTNIVGNLLTSQTDYMIIVNEVFNEPAEYVYVWDGSEMTAPEEVTAGTYEISQASELAWLAAAVNGTLPATRAAVAADSFAGKTFVLTKDIDLGSQEWTPIGTSDNPFKGTFDGNGKTISNLVVTGGSESNKGLFGVTHDGEIKNLTVKNAYVSGRLAIGVVAGQPYTSTYSNISVTGHVEVNGIAYVGGVGGRNAYGNWTAVTVNADETSYVKAHSIVNGTAYRSYVGGVVGFNGEGPQVFESIASNIDVKGSTSDAGGLFGIANYGNQFVNCTCSGNVELYAAEDAEDAEEIGGIAGVWNNETGYTVTFTDCSFNGTLSVNIEGVDLSDNTITGAQYSETGTGELLIFVLVENQEELAAAFANGNSIILNNDIVLSENWIPAGTSDKPYKGVFDGKGHKISGVKVAETDYAALIAYAGENTTIKNLTLEDVDINSTKHAAGVVCIAGDGLLIDNVTVSGNITAASYAGGLVHNGSYATITNSVNNANVSATRAGGIGSWLTVETYLENVTNNGDITGIIGASGIVHGFAGTIRNAVNTGNVTSANVEAAAGIAGVQKAASTYEYCYNYGNITSEYDDPNSSAAGILGQSPGSASTLRYCANYGAVTAEQSYAGGIAYSLYGTINASYCYNAGTVTGADGAGGIAPKAQYGTNDKANYCLNAGAVTSAYGNVYQGSNKNVSCYYYNEGVLLNVADGSVADAAEALVVLNGGNENGFFSIEDGEIVARQ